MQKGIVYSHMNNNPFGRSAGARTLDPLIKSQLLYQLSYRPVFRTTKIENIRCYCSSKIA